MTIGILQWYNTIIKLIDKDHTKDYREKIHDIITSRDNTPFQRSVSCTTKKTDLIIKDSQQEISIRDFLREHYNTAPYVYPGGQFLFEMRWYWNKRIYYQPECIESIGFRFAIFHEWAHSRNYAKDQKIYKLFDKHTAMIHNEKRARTDGYMMAKKFQSIYGMDTLEEFTSITDVCSYANMHLLTNLANGKMTAKDIKHLILREDQFV